MNKPESFLTLGLTEIAEKIRGNELTSEDLVIALLERIDTVDLEINSYITVNKKEAIETARERTKELKGGVYRGVLHGVPIGLKDIISTEGLKTTCGSQIYENHIPKKDAEIVSRLKEAGAIIIGKHNTHQFAYGPTGDRSFAGAVRNPHDQKKISGGSSSGSAAAVASNLCFGAIGTDTGGSIRVPSSFCGVVGMKPTFGRVSKKGIYPVSWTLDHAGPITKNVKDNATLLNVISGYDFQDPDAVYSKVEDFTRFIGKEIRGKTIGIPKEFFYEDLNKEVEKSLITAIRNFKEMGVEVVEINIPSIEAISAAHKIILSSEAYAVHEKNLEKYPDMWDEEVKKRLLTGLQPTGIEFARALRVQKLAKQEFNEALEKVDILVTPTVPILPPNINERYLSDKRDDENHIRWKIVKLATPTDLNGFPSLTLPCGFSESGLPIGVQLIGKEFEEAKIYQFGYALEQKLQLKSMTKEVNY